MRRPPACLSLTLVLAACLLLGSGECREQRRDPVTGRIRILYIGDPGPSSPYPVYIRDPLTEVVPVIAIGFTQPTTVIRRYMRLYMPRTRGNLVNSYDMIVISDASRRFFTDEHTSWFRDAVVQDGLALIMIGGYETFGATIYTPGSWGDTHVAEALPVECLTDRWEEKPGRLEIAHGANPLASSLPFDQIGPYGTFYGCNIVIPKEGSVLIARYRTQPTGDRHPLFCYMEVGAGSSYAQTTDWTPAGGRDFLRWPHYGDYALNLAIYITGGRLPDDLERVYEARQLMNQYRDLRLTLDAVVEFASKFGANMARAEAMVGDAEKARGAAERHYLDAEMDECIDGLRNALDLLSAASDRAYALKDEAMLWVYITEWLVVSATGMLCGFILWTIMVRRRLYREIGETRLRSI